MTEPTHVGMLNGSGRGLILEGKLSIAEQFHHILNIMDGTNRWAFAIWKVIGKLDQLNPRTWDAGQDEYIQCAGVADALMVELRVLDEHANPRQIALGKPTSDKYELPSEVISWDNNRYSAKVYPNEVFTANEAADIFYEYYLNGPDALTAYTVREITL